MFLSPTLTEIFSEDNIISKSAHKAQDSVCEKYKYTHITSIHVIQIYLSFTVYSVHFEH